MALNFLKHKIVPAILIKTKALADGDMVQTAEENDKGLDEASEDLLKAIQSESKSRISKALRAAFQILDAEPHEEGEHLNDEDES